MNARHLFAMMALLCFCAYVKPTASIGQSLTDSTVNFYSISAYYDYFYDSLLNLRGIDSMKGTGYTDYLRWKWFYTSRHGVNGDLGSIWDGIREYHNNFHTPEGYSDDSDWRFIGPLGIPLRHDDQPSRATGKGMMLSLWVSGGDHSLIYAGSHHGGLWKTTNGGEISMHENFPEIVWFCYTADYKIDTAQAALQLWVDGGNTQQVLDDISFSTPLNAYDLYSGLMLTSPYLSDTTLIESVLKEDVLNNEMIEDILVANPQSAKTARIQDAMDSKFYPLTEQQRELIDQGKYTVSARETLEARLASEKHHRDMILGDLITYYKCDTINAWAKDSLKALLESENTPHLLYQLAFVRLNEGDTAGAMSALNYTGNAFNFDNEAQNVHQQYVDFAALYPGLISPVQPVFNADPAERSALYTLAGYQTFPGIYALNVLQFFDTLTYFEPYPLPRDQEKAGKGRISIENKKYPENDIFRIYPNPARSYFVASYTLSKPAQASLELVIADLSGRTMATLMLPAGANHQIISTKDFQPGLYLCKFVLNGKEKHTTKLTVAND